MSTSFSNQDALQRSTGKIPATPRGVTFAQPIADYRPPEAQEREYSSSSDESDINSSFYSSGHTSQVESFRSERGLLESTYLQRIDYRALLASLRTNEAHDTAQHLLTVAMLKRLPASHYQAITDKKLRATWTAWPLNPDQTKHSENAKVELTEELKAVLHRVITKNLRRSGKDISADELPESVSDTGATVMLAKMTSLLENIGQLRRSQCGRATATIKRLNLLRHEDIAILLKECKILSSESETRVLERVKELFGEPTNFEQSATEREATPIGSPSLVAEEVALGPGRWAHRGYKRRGVSNEEEQSTPTRTPRVNGRLYAEQVTSDSGRRFAKNVRLVPAHFAEQERPGGQSLISTLFTSEP